MQFSNLKTDTGNDAKQLIADDEHFMTIHEVCRFWGGDRPLHPASIYRKMAAGYHPRPVKIGHSARWLLSELKAERARLVAAR